MQHQIAAPVDTRQTVEDAFQRILRATLASVKEWEPTAIAGEDPEGVHQVRVGLRRMRSALGVFRPAIPPEATRPLAKDMRWAAKTLDHARDLDVYIEENLGSGKKKGKTGMRKLAIKEREVAYGSVRGLLRGKRFTKFTHEFSQWLDARAWRSVVSEPHRARLQQEIRPFASWVLEQHRTQVLQYGKDVSRLDSEQLHKLRIDCKKLRYATEFFSPLYGKQIDGFNNDLKALQELLGTLHDTVVMTGLQRELLRGHRDAKLQRQCDRLKKRRWKQAEEVRRELLHRWQAFSEADRPWVTDSPVLH
jgi:CHAD domain-containing protein